MPTTQLQLRRGTSAQTAIFTGAVGEVTVDTDKKTLIVHDGTTVGGTEIALKSRTDASYSAANTADQRAVTSGSYANSAYTQANTATTNAATADQRAVTSGSYANSAYTQANTATNNAATADQRAVTSGSYANSAYAKANTVASDLSSANTWLQSYVNTQVTNLVDSAPLTLDTLNELAAALGDDANFSTTITTMVGVTGSYANSAYSQANTATTNAATADQRAVTSGSYANSAYTAANTADQRAVTSGSYANSAYTQANTANAKIYISESALATNTANQTIDSYAISQYRTSKYLIQAISGSSVHCEELLVTHDDNIVYFTEYAVVTNANTLFDVYATIQSNTVMINVSPVSSNTQIDFSRLALIARTIEPPSLQGDLMSLTGTVDLLTDTGSEDLNA